MIISFTITNYKSRLGENLYLTGSAAELGAYDPQHAVPLAYINGQWTGQVKFAQAVPGTYQYFSNLQQDSITRALPRPVDDQILYVRDDWAPLRTDPWFAQALEVAFPRLQERASVLAAGGFHASQLLTAVVFRLRTAYPTQSAQLAGSFSGWQPQEMIYIGSRTWELKIEFNSTANVEFKFLSDYEWEAGENRLLGDLRGVNLTTHFFRYAQLPTVRLAGVAVPVFSLYSKAKICGDFFDLLKMGTFCQKIGHSVLQVLPVNDTLGSYPYSVLSSFALNIVYLDVGAYGAEDFAFAEAKSFDYDAAREYKEKVMRAWFCRQNYEKTLQEVRNWLNASELVQFWLPSYCVFRMFARKFGTCQFRAWGAHPALARLEAAGAGCTERAKQLLSLFSNTDKVFSEEEHTEVVYQAIVQYKLHQQLEYVAKQLFSMRVFLMGDMPIGVSPHSCDCWAFPELFSTTKVLGAPPDAFSENGQNWGFPVFNFEQDQKSDYSYCRARFASLQQYFKALRIDHILGWFRTWQIGADQQDGNGRLGVFQPSIPLQWRELEEHGIYDRDRLLCRIVNEDAGQCQASDLQRLEALKILGKDVFQHYQIRVSERAAFQMLRAAQMSPDERVYLGKIVSRLNANVCLLKDDSHPDYDCHPSFCNLLEKTSSQSFKTLDFKDQEFLRQRAFEYYNERQTELWRLNGRKNLQLIQKCTDALVIGEDLGFSADYVSQEMHACGIPGMWVLQLQADPVLTTVQNLAYATTGTHDCPSLQGFFLHGEAHAKNIYQRLLKKPFARALSASDEQKIVMQVMATAAMLCVIPIQDLLDCFGPFHCPTEGVDGQRINDPSDPVWRWDYRLPRELDEVIENEDFVGMLGVMTKESGRWHE